MLYTNMWITMQILNICPCIYYSYAERMSYILIILSFNLIKSYLKKKKTYYVYVFMLETQKLCIVCMCVWYCSVVYCIVQSILHLTYYICIYLLA